MKTYVRSQMWKVRLIQSKNVFFLSLNNWGLNFLKMNALNSLRLPLIRKTKKTVYFSMNDEINQNFNFANFLV